jgi:putative addiction module component (TIGR02574 family)
MATPIEKITREVVELSRHERLTLLRLLLDLDQPSKGEEIAKAWDQEIRARVKAVDEGRVSGIPYDQIKQEMSSRFRAR